MKHLFPWLALGLGILLSLILLLFAPFAPDAGGSMPLLTALLVSEFGFLVTVIAAVLDGLEIAKSGIRSLRTLVFAGNLLLAINFARLGLVLWPGTGAG